MTTTTNPINCPINLWGQQAGVNNGVPYGYTTLYTVKNNTATETFTGVSNPFWKSQIRNHMSATTPASGVRYIYEPSFLTSTIAYKFWSNNALYVRDSRADGYIGSDGIATLTFPPPSASLLMRVSNRAISKFLDKATSARTAFEAGQDLGEIRETVESLIHPLSSLRKHVTQYFDLLKKARFRYKRPVSLRKALSDTYLEFTFGWNPLAADIGDAIAKLPGYHFASVPIEAGATDHESYAATATGTYGPTSWMPSAYAFEQEFILKYQERYKGEVRTGADATGRIPLAQGLQLTPEYWLPTAWDLLPYSWIADYFTNIGDLIRAYSFVSGNLLWVNKTVRTSHTIYLRKLSWPPNAYYIPAGSFDVDISVYGGNRRMTRIAFTRESINPVLLVPSFAFSIPLSSKPWENIGALFASRVPALTPFF